MWMLNLANGAGDKPALDLFKHVGTIFSAIWNIIINNPCYGALLIIIFMAAGIRWWYFASKDD